MYYSGTSTMASSLRFSSYEWSASVLQQYICSVISLYLYCTRTVLKYTVEPNTRKRLSEIQRVSCQLRTGAGDGRWDEKPPEPPCTFFHETHGISHTRMCAMLRSRRDYVRMAIASPITGGRPCVRVPLQRIGPASLQGYVAAISL